MTYFDYFSGQTPSKTGILPHVTWCATGPLAFLPLHAAGLYDTQEDPKVFNYAVCSYTPTVTALVRSSRKTTLSAPHILAISQPSTPGHRSLPGTVTEVQAIEHCIGSRNIPFTWLDGKKATIANVLECMAKSNWCHFACHGLQDRGDPIESAFAMQDGSLSLRTIMSKSFPSADIAFLSACQTATGDEKRPEEAVHLAAGMLMAGFRSVFATMWSIGDRDAPLVVKEVYTYLLEDGQNNRGREAYALHHALGQLRKEVSMNAFGKWVPFVHFGG